MPVFHSPYFYKGYVGNNILIGIDYTHSEKENVLIAYNFNGETKCYGKPKPENPAPVLRIAPTTPANLLPEVQNTYSNKTYTHIS